MRGGRRARVQASPLAPRTPRGGGGVRGKAAAGGRAGRAAGREGRQVRVGRRRPDGRLSKAWCCGALVGPQATFQGSEPPHSETAFRATRCSVRGAGRQSRSARRELSLPSRPGPGPGPGGGSGGRAEERGTPRGRQRQEPLPGALAPDPESPGRPRPPGSRSPPRAPAPRAGGWAAALPPARPPAQFFQTLRWGSGRPVRIRVPLPRPASRSCRTFPTPSLCDLPPPRRGLSVPGRCWHTTPCRRAPGRWVPAALPARRASAQDRSPRPGWRRESRRRAPCGGCQPGPRREERRVPSRHGLPRAVT